MSRVYLLVLVEDAFDSFGDPIPRSATESSRALASSGAWRYIVPCLIALGPILFAGVIFAQTFRDTSNPDQALGSNIAGAVLGGLAESLSGVLGFQYLLLVAMGFYLLSVWPPRLRQFPA